MRLSNTRVRKRRKSRETHSRAMFDTFFLSSSDSFPSKLKPETHKPFFLPLLRPTSLSLTHTTSSLQASYYATSSLEDTLCPSSHQLFNTTNKMLLLVSSMSTAHLLSFMPLSITHSLFPQFLETQVAFSPSLRPSCIILTYY